ncbi:CHAT domain-containing protein [Streptomyces spinoverrucosus]|uniref:CHAT domain-containing protein n=1 Tax=Streptomyces spinoverrucosus TaxID=284043 RepID=UPI0018C409E1|nr:CHAT domain-containing protein [Streptomyces spinoverrucosus]MBG0852851.1 CHAT domain-containing protein [Streptomyces spinoverrucosus]
MTADDAQTIVDELRARREEILDALAETASDDPDAPALCALAGELSYRLHILADDPDDLGLAAQAFELAFEAPGDDEDWAAWRVAFGHVRAFQYDIDPRPELVDEVWALLTEGTGALPPDDADYASVRELGAQLLAACAKQRYLHCDGPARQRLELLDEALRRYEAAAATVEPGGQDAVDLAEARGFLYLERCELDRVPGDAEAAAAHYRSVLDAALPSSDLPLVRYSLGLALMVHGRATSDRDELEQAREEFGTALLEARQRTGSEPSWAWEAGIRSALVRFLLWANWKDQAQAAAAEVELNGLLADPADVERLVPVFLDSFGRLLYERASARGDGPGRDRAIGLIRRAIDIWVPERDGLVTVTALFLGMFQQSRYRDDPDPARLHDVTEACALVLRDDDFSTELRHSAQMMGLWAWTTLRDEHGITPASPDDIPEAMRVEGARDAYLGLLHDLDDGGIASLNFGDTDDDFPGIFKGLGGGVAFKEAFDKAYAFFAAQEKESDRALFALNLLSQGMLLDPHGTIITEAQKSELVDTVLSHRQDDPEWQRKAHAVVAQVRLREELRGSGRGMDTVLDHLARADAAGAGLATGVDDGVEAAGAGPAGGTDDRLGHGIDIARFAAMSHRGQTAGARDDLEAAGELWRRLRDSTALSPYQRRAMGGQQAGFEAQAAAQRGDLAATDAHIAELLAAHAELDPDDGTRIELWTMLENARSARDRLAHELGAPPAPPLAGRPAVAELRRAARGLPRDHRAWVLGDNGINRFMRAGQTGDPVAVTEAMELIQEAYDLADEGSDSKLRYGFCLGAGHCGLAESQRFPTARARHLAQGIALLEDAFRTAGGPEHRLYAGAGLALGRAYRTRGELRRDDKGMGRRTGLDALRGHAWAALLQSGTEHAAQAVAMATTTALEVAGWCLRDNALDEAVQALDACRGLLLHAATTSRTVPERLVAAGHDTLAEEWRAAGLASAPADPFTALQAPMSVPSALRRRVLAALTGTDATQDRLLDPPAPDEIATALRTLRKDALVYLVPAGEDTPGTAVVVTATGAVHSVPLPTLTEDAAALREYARAPHADAVRLAQDARDATPFAAARQDQRVMGPVPGWSGTRPDLPSLRERLDRLCGWAWYAGMRPLLDVFATRTGRAPRLVFVPMGTLGLVPWHAAWTQGPEGRRRYALHEAEISYAASARLLCDVAARPEAAHSGAALVVGNPTGDLRWAGAEADAVQRAFYPRGRFLGRREGGDADGPGTPQEVLSWLTGTDSPDEEGAVLHLACHASIARTARRTAHLSLHDGELAAEELTEAVAGAGRGRLGLVVLAACRSHVSGRGHNEAYSLATAFLVAGARSVVGSLWPVPDDATSVLMFLTHHFLRTEGEPPARALRRAQLWMLDPARDLPAGLPARLAERAAHIDPDDLSAWAGFTHLGQ